MSSPPVIRAKFLESEQYYQTAWKRNPKKPRYWLVLAIGIPFAGLQASLEAMKDHREGRPWWVALVICPAVLAVVWFWLLSPAAQWRMMRGRLRKTLSHPPTEAWAEFSDGGLLLTGKDGKTTFHPWTAIALAIELHDGVMFYLDPDCQSFTWMPQSSFASPGDYAELRALLTRKVARFDPAMRLAA